MIQLLRDICDQTEKAFARYDFSSKPLILQLYTYGPTNHHVGRNMSDNLKEQYFFKSIFEEYIYEIYGKDSGFKIQTDRYTSIPTVLTKGLEEKVYSRDVVSIINMLKQKFGAVNLEVSS